VTVVHQTTTTPTNATTIKLQVSVNASAIVSTPNGKGSDPQATLNQVLANQSQNPQQGQATYLSNSTFEKTKQDIIAKVPTATPVEQSEIVKVSPWIWNYVAQSSKQNQNFVFSTLLTTGRIADTTINGTADLNSSDILQQNMPKLLKAFGDILKADAFDEAEDIDVLSASQVYQDYLAG